ncbi:cobalt-precorrin-5B (C(1))-methyltransferase CbiD [Bacillota bacterium LX-D]|nr:cobalt-precorrin-5B (C(1))-methyltransferase CbiD [Bacillota bacterium LX-D]
MEVLTISNLKALANTKLVINQGEAIAIFGTNGSGKTSFLGELEQFFLNYSTENSFKLKIGYLAQTDDNKAINMSVTEYVASGLHNKLMQKDQLKEKVHSYLEQIQMSGYEKNILSDLSSIQKRMVSLARILVEEPKIIILDEPAAGMDQGNTNLLFQVLKGLHQQKTTIIYATSNLDLIPMFADKIIVLEDGKAILADAPESVFNNPALLMQDNLNLHSIRGLFIPNEKNNVQDYLTVGQALQNLSKFRNYDGKMWRRGYTTGSCAAAAAKGAVLALLKGDSLDKVEITTPLNTTIEIPIKNITFEQNKVSCSVLKDGGDDPDITHGMEIKASVTLTGQGIQITGGHGVGIVTKPGLAVQPGLPAINPVPRKMIKDAVSPFLAPDQGLKIEISVPEGEKAAAKTLNPKLGIIGGISILGTTGIVEPMSEEAFKTSLVPQVTMAQALGYSTIVLTPGRMGQKRAAEYFNLPENAVIQMSNFVGFMLKECSRLGVSNIILYGHIGKLVKVAGGIFHTHSKVADARLEIMATHAFLNGADADLVKRIVYANTAEEAVGLIKEAKMDYLFNILAEAVSRKAESHVANQIKIGTILTALNGDFLGQDKTAAQLIYELRCSKIC